MKYKVLPVNNRFKILFLFFIIISFPSGAGEQKKDVWLTVFVHGIISIKPHITLSNFIRFLNDNVTESIYYHTVALMRDDPFFYQNQAIQGKGLVPIDPHKNGPGAASNFMAWLFEYMDKKVQTDAMPQNYYYTYGWSGLLSRSARYQDAKEFYTALHKEIEKFRARGIEPKLRLIGYSHGGKILIHLADVFRSENVDKTMHIDEILLFGMPIECRDVAEINTPFFKKVYNIYSDGDRIQQLDFFSCGQFFSERLFKARRGLPLPDNLVQVQVKVIRSKGEKNRPLSQGPLTNCPLFDGFMSSRNLRNVSPGHTELWFFAWTPMHYRPTFPLYPFPLVAFTPYILSIINEVKHEFCPKHPIKIIIDPRRSSMILQNRTCTTDLFKAPFLPIHEFVTLQDKAQAYWPLNFNGETYNEHIDTALEEAIYLATHKKCVPVNCSIK